MERADSLHQSEFQEMDIRVLLEYDEDAGAYSATCPELNFVSSCGETKEQALKNLPAT
jgi:predicted RNase H-like HicB family nuclease